MPVILKLVSGPVRPLTFLFSEKGVIVVPPAGSAQPTYWRSDWFGPEAATWFAFVRSGRRTKFKTFAAKRAAVPGMSTLFAVEPMVVTAVTVMVVPLMRSEEHTS